MISRYIRKRRSQPTVQLYHIIDGETLESLASCMYVEDIDILYSGLVRV